MRRFRNILSLLLILAVTTIFSCKKQTETYATATIADYLPTEVGKYIIYRLDSTVFLNFGKRKETHAYQVKFEVNAQLNDNEGRPAYRIYRYIRDSAGTQSWAPDNTFYITPLDNQVEYTEDNLRFIKLHLPVKDGYTWKGNKYLPNEPYIYLFDIQNDDYDNMNDWDYYYNGDEQASLSIEDQTYQNVISVNYTEDPTVSPTDTIPMTDTVIVTRSNLDEKYAKGIGLVYRAYSLWDHQPNETVIDPGDPNDPVNHPKISTFDPFTNGFAIKMWMIDHN